MNAVRSNNLSLKNIKGLHHQVLKIKKFKKLIYGKDSTPLFRNGK